jgi:hypothetical protein
MTVIAELWNMDEELHDVEVVCLSNAMAIVC